MGHIFLDGRLFIAVREAVETDEVGEDHGHGEESVFGDDQVWLGRELNHAVAWRPQAVVTGDIERTGGAVYGDLRVVATGSFGGAKGSILAAEEPAAVLGLADDCLTEVGELGQGLGARPNSGADLRGVFL